MSSKVEKPDKMFFPRKEAPGQMLTFQLETRVAFSNTNLL
jgi:hypothetical protein